MDQAERESFKKLEDDKAALLREMKNLLVIADMFCGPGLPMKSPAEAVLDMRKAAAAAWEVVNKASGR